MFRVAASVFAPVLLALLAGPVGFAASQASRPDPSNLYLVIGARQTLDTALNRASVREVGPSRAPFARLVQMPPGFHAWLVNGGYLVLPASALAELCGIDLSS